MELKSTRKLFVLIVISSLIVMGTSGVLGYQTDSEEVRNSSLAQRGEVEPVITEDTSFSGEIPP